MPLKLADASGGLNTRDPASALTPTQLAVKDNCHTDGNGFLEKRGGQDLISILPPNSRPFEADADTLALWHLDEAVGAGVFVDAGANGENLTPGDESSIIRQAPGVFPLAGPYGVRFIQANQHIRNGYLTKALAGGDPLKNAQPEITFEAWVVIPTTYTGRPHGVVIGPPPLTTIKWSDTGAPLVALLDAAVFHGLKIWRDASTTAPIADTSEPYVTFEFKLATYAAPFVLRTAFLPTNRKLHIRGVYSATKKKATLWVNGKKQSSVAVPLGGSLAALAAATPRILLGGMDTANKFGPSFTGALDEVRISAVARADTDWPYDKLHAPLMPYAKADGTRQLVFQAGGGLYYEVGDGKPIAIATLDPASQNPFSEEANFDGRQFGDILYLSNGTDSPLAWNGSRLVSWGEPVLPPTLTEDAGPMTATAGKHFVRLRYRYGDEVTGPGPAAEITISVGNINVSDILTRHDNCTSIQVEMTKTGAGIDGDYFLAREITNDASVPSLEISGAWVDESDPAFDEGALGVPDGSQPTNLHDQPAYALRTAEENNTGIGHPKHLLPAHNRMFTAGDVNTPYDLPYSKINNPDCFGPFDSARFKTDAGEIIGMGLSHDDVLVSKGGKSTSCLRGIDPSSWIIVENVHPTRGAVDHWGFVHRYPGEGGDYVLLSLCEDGIYAYQGGSMNRVSDLITPTIKALATASASRQDFIDTTFEDFELAKANGGGATQNIDTPQYEQDGLREAPGKVKIVNQLDYIGLWNGSNPLVAGKVTAICKGAGEGEFYFCTDDNENVYRTLNNFVTAAALAVALPGGMRGIEILRYLDAATGVENLVVFTASIANVNTGVIRRIEDPVGAGGIGPNLVFVSDGSGDGGNWGWMLDVPWVASSQFWKNKDLPQGGTNDNRNFYRVGNGAWTPGDVFDSFTGDKNIFINHEQRVRVVINNKAGANSHGYAPALVLESQASRDAAAVVYGPDVDHGGGFIEYNVKEHYFDGQKKLLPNGFYGFHDDAARLASPDGSLSHWSSGDSSNGFQVYFTRREAALWKAGGTMRPQAIYVAGTSQWAYFVGAGKADDDGNVISQLWALNLDDNSLISVDSQVSAIALDPNTNTLYYSSVFVSGDPTTGFGFRAFIGSIDALTTAFIAAENLDKFNYLPLRLQFNPQTSLLSATGKKFDQSIGAASDRDTWTYQGFVVNLKGVALSDTLVQEPTGFVFDYAGDGGPVPVEIAYQSDSPFAEHVAMDKITTAALLSFDKDHAVLTNERALPYISPDAAFVATGIRSQLLFVEQSGAGGGNIWADRLYWQTDGAAAPRFVQHGLAGEWTVIGTFTSEVKDLGAPTSFGSFLAVFGGPQVEFLMRNAANPGLLAASELAVTPNKKILGFAPLRQYGQWVGRLTWTYSLDDPTVSPFIDSVDIVFYLGVTNAPRVCAEHFNGRTYFFVARAGSEQNDLVLIYDKKNAWGTFAFFGREWQVESACIFLGQFVGIQGFGLVGLESGGEDLGTQIILRARPGTLMTDMDAFLDDVAANVKTWENKAFTSSAGSVLVKPYAGEVEIADAAWKFALPVDGLQQMRRVLGEPVVAWKAGWGNAFTLQIETDPNGVVNQLETIQAVDAKVVVSGPERERFVS